MMTTKEREWPNYRTLWRWHFYAGLFCIPFVIFLSLTGSIYLFKPQIEAYLDRDFEQLAAPELHKPLSEQVGKVLVAFPDAKSVQVELPKFQEGATRVILKSPNKHLRVFVHPRTLDILATRNEAEAPMRIIKQLHGQLRFGTWGSYIVELAASWTLIMLLTGLALWWPRNAKGLGGVLYPRLHKGSRVACRDFHSVLGMWVSIFAMFLIVTGLPWAKFWGSYFRSVRAATGLVATQQDWTLGGQGTSKREIGRAHV